MDGLEGPGAQAGARAPAYDDLLSAPSTSKPAEAAYTRASAAYANMDERFRVAKRTYERQYAQLYFSRLMLLKGYMRQRVEQVWPGLPVCSILEVQESKEVAVIGTLYKNMKLKPSILDEYTKDRGLRAALGGADFCSPDDSVVLEDEGARMALSVAAVQQQGAEGSGVEPLDVQALVTGVVLAVRGVHEPGGDFVVSAVCFPGLPPNPQPFPHPLPAPTAAKGDAPAACAGDKYVALVSGLGMGGSKVDMLKTQLALDFLTGNLGSQQEQQLAAKVVRLVMAGGGIGQLDALAAAGTAAAAAAAVAATGGGASSTAASRSAAASAALQPVRELDLLLAELCAALPVDVMPGAEDPANVALPQQPMHRCLFPGVSQVQSGAPACVRATNPHEAELDGVRLLGTSGQNVDDMAKYCSVKDRLDLMESQLRCRHLAPTAPDTLTCYPYTDADPFIVSTTPHIYFAGNQPEFATRLVSEDVAVGAQGRGGTGAGKVVVRLVAVPSFARTGTLVLVNLRTLQCHPVKFDGSLGL